MIKFLLFPFLILLVLLSVGCQSQPASETVSTVIENLNDDYPAPEWATPYPGPQAASYPTPEPFVFPDSGAGGITVHGFMIIKNLMTNLPGMDDPIYLVPLAADAEVGTIPPFTAGEVPQATVDERTFEFVFTDIDPGMYAIVVLTLDGMQVPASFYENGNLAIITLQESDRDQTFEVEEITTQ